MSCNKVTYKTRAAAVDAAHSLARRLGARVTAYRCKECRLPSGARAWHIGHQGKRSNPGWTALNAIERAARRGRAA